MEKNEELTPELRVLIMGVNVALDNLAKRRLGVEASAEGLKAQMLLGQEVFTDEQIDNLVAEAKAIEKRVNQIGVEYAELAEFTRKNLPAKYHIRTQ